MIAELSTHNGLAIDQNRYLSIRIDGGERLAVVFAFEQIDTLVFDRQLQMLRERAHLAWIRRFEIVDLQARLLAFTDTGTAVAPHPCSDTTSLGRRLLLRTLAPASRFLIFKTAGLDERYRIVNDVGRTHDERMRLLDDDEISHALDLRSLDGDLAVVGIRQ